MYAITLNDDSPKNPTPWLTMIYIGLKTDESRTWPIPSTMTMPFDVLLCASADSRTPFAGHGVCVVTITGCEKFEQRHVEAACISLYDGYVWHTENLRWLSEPVPVKGRWGFFHVNIPPTVRLFAPIQSQLADERRRFIKKYKHIFEP